MKIKGTKLLIDGNVIDLTRIIAVTNTDFKLDGTPLSCEYYFTIILDTSDKIKIKRTCPMGEGEISSKEINKLHKFVTDAFMES